MAINMSYCRFQNTLAALRECRDALRESANPIEELSDEERAAAKKLLRLCSELVQDLGDGS